MSKEVDSLNEFVTVCETLDAFRLSSDVIRAFRRFSVPFQVIRRTVEDVTFLDADLELNVADTDTYNKVLSMGRDFASKDGVEAEQYVLDLFDLDPSRPSFAVDAVKEYMSHVGEVDV